MASLSSMSDTESEPRGWAAILTAPAMAAAAICVAFLMISGILALVMVGEIRFRFQNFARQVHGLWASKPRALAGTLSHVEINQI